MELPAARKRKNTVSILLWAQDAVHGGWVHAHAQAHKPSTKRAVLSVCANSFRNKMLAKRENLWIVKSVFKAPCTKLGNSFAARGRLAAHASGMLQLSVEPGHSCWPCRQRRRHFCGPPPRCPQRWARFGDVPSEAHCTRRSKAAEPQVEQTYNRRR